MSLQSGDKYFSVWKYPHSDKLSGHSEKRRASKLNVSALIVLPRTSPKSTRKLNAENSACPVGGMQKRKLRLVAIPFSPAYWDIWLPSLPIFPKSLKPI